MTENPILKQSVTYTFKYGSDGDSIDLNTLLLSQIHFGSILNEIKNEVAADADLSIKIKPLEKGSVPFDIILNVSWIQTLFSPEVVGYASGIVSILVGLIQLKKWTKGDKPTSIEINGDQVTVTIGDNVILVDRSAYKLYEENAVVNLALKKAFEAVEKDEDVNSIEIIDEKKTSLITVPREYFSGMTEDNKIFESLKKTESTPAVNLIINKVVFEKGYKWGFYMQGRKISATIDDPIFMERVKNGEKFGQGDILEVELEIEKVFDKSLNTYIEKEFKVKRVIQHKPRSEQGTLI